MRFILNNISLSDLVGSNESRKREALAILPDEDLMFAVMVINSRPIYPGTDLENTALELARLFLHCKSTMGAIQVASVLFEVVDTSSLVKALAAAHSPSSSNARESLSDKLNSVSGIAHSNAFFDAALRAEMKRVTSQRLGTSQEDLLISLVKLSSDTASIAVLASSIRSQVSKAALHRLVELGATNHLDDLFDNGSPFFYEDSTARLVIRNVSKSRVLGLASDPNCSFIYRDEAMRLLDPLEVEEIMGSTEHLNVRESAKLALKAMV
jgi:hypothetical protein